MRYFIAPIIALLLAGCSSQTAKYQPRTTPGLAGLSVALINPMHVQDNAVAAAGFRQLVKAGCKPTEAALADLTVEQRPTGMSVELLIRSKHGAIVHDDEFGTVFMVGDAEDSTDEFIRIAAPRYWKDKKYFQ